MKIFMKGLLICLFIVREAAAQQIVRTPQVGDVYTYEGPTIGAQWEAPTGNAVPSVPNNTALALMAGTAGQTVYRSGFYLPGDGGGAMYVYSATPCALNGGNGDNGYQVKSGTGCWITTFDRTFDSRIWGINQTLADNSTVLAAVFTACNAWGGGTVTIPVGNFKFTSTVNTTQGCRLKGGGSGVKWSGLSLAPPTIAVTQLNWQGGGNGPVITIGPSVMDSGVEDVSCNGNVADGSIITSNHVCIKTDSAMRYVIRNISCYNTGYCLYYTTSTINNEFNETSNIMAVAVKSGITISGATGIAVTNQKFDLIYVWDHRGIGIDLFKDTDTLHFGFLFLNTSTVGAYGFALNSAYPTGNGTVGDIHVDNVIFETDIVGAFSLSVQGSGISNDFRAAFAGAHGINASVSNGGSASIFGVNLGTSGTNLRAEQMQFVGGVLIGRGTETVPVLPSINGGTSGTGNGAALFVQNGGVTKAAIGNYSAVTGAAYNSEGTFFTPGPMHLYANDNSTLNCAQGLKTNSVGTLSCYTFATSVLSNALGADVLLNNISNYFDGPSVAQGTTGTWSVSGSVTLYDTTGAATYFVKLWDGTTVIAATQVQSTAANVPIEAHLSGVLTSPAGNLRISVRDLTATTGKMLFNATGTSKDGVVTAVRIQ